MSESDSDTDSDPETDIGYPLSDILLSPTSAKSVEVRSEPISQGNKPA